MQVLEIFNRFFVLGCISFGGPAAHIGYFQTVFVDKLAWLNQEQYAKLVALSQFLPGPGSSQVGFAIGLQRGGLIGGIASFLGFTLPSFVLMFLLASSATNQHWASAFNGVVTGLKLLAVVVVADAIFTMFKAFCRQKETVIIAIASALTLVFFASVQVQILALMVAAVLGTLVQGTNKKAPNTAKISIGWIPLVLFSALLIGMPLIGHNSVILSLFSDFFNAGSLVFGGGHVVLPLLQQSVGDALGNDQFLIGYAAAQAVPGPMFTLATYLGAQLSDYALIGALVATLAIFLPGFLLVLALKGSWEVILNKPSIAGATLGINAAVVGLLIATFYQPVLSSAIHNGWGCLRQRGGLFGITLRKVPHHCVSRLLYRARVLLISLTLPF